nr:F-box domain-containing protein [Tanacetum cinerariifolium]
MLFGFGVHHVTLDPTVLKINYSYYGQGPWYVSVFTLSYRTWYKLESYSLPRESMRIKRSGQAVVGGKIFWVGLEKFYGDDGISYKLYMLVSFDLITHQFQVIDIPKEMLVGQYLPPYYISQLRDCIIISGSFKFVDFSIIYAWELQVNDGEVSCATNYVIAFGGTVTGCLGDIDNFLKKGKLGKVVAIVKSFYPDALEDLNVTLKDVSGTVPGIIHYKVLDFGSYEKDITVGAAMILANVSVFTPKPSEHYLSITKRNVVEVFRKDAVSLV